MLFHTYIYSASTKETWGTLVFIRLLFINPAIIFAIHLD